MREGSPPSRLSRLKQLLTWPFILLILFFWWQSVRELALGATLARARGNEGFLGMALFCAWLYLLGQAVVWRAITSALATPIPWRQGMRAWMLSNLARYLPGSVWHLVGRVYLTQQAGGSRTNGVLGVLLEQGLQLLSALLLVALTLPFWPSESPVRAQSWLLLLIPVGLVGIHPRLFFPLMNRALALLGREPLPAALRYRQMLGYLLSYLGVH
nr:flippase-like domain-containing protein [Ardenticatenales bacterium]